MVKKFSLIRYLFMNNLEFLRRGTIDAINVIFEKAKTTLKRIASPHVFVENE